MRYVSSDPILTIKDVDKDFFGLCVGRIALVLPRIRRPCILNQEEGRRYVALYRDHRHAPAQRVVIYYLHSAQETATGSWIVEQEQGERWKLGELLLLFFASQLTKVLFNDSTKTYLIVVVPEYVGRWFWGV